MIYETTKIMYSKNMYFHELVFDERFELFKSFDGFNNEKYFNVRDYIIKIHKRIVRLNRAFLNRRRELIKWFNYEKYHLLLSSVLIYDLRCVVISFLF